MKTIFTLSLIIILTIGSTIFPCIVFSQSPRMVLIEEATNASCAPCATQNPTFKGYLSRSDISQRCIPIIYHANWPGRDDMNSANAAMHNGRVQYYSITGVPTAVLNGRKPTKVRFSYDGAPADTAAFTSALNLISLTSPISIEINEQINGNSVEVSVKVSSSEAVVSKKIRIAVVERYHYYQSAGTNGEKDFYFVTRQMLPSHTGIDLSLSASELKTFTESFTIDPGWNADEIHVVAFVQDDNTKEVLQAGTDRVNLTVRSVAARTYIQTSPNQPWEFNGEVITPMEGEYTLNIKESFPQGWSSEIKINDVAVTNNSKIQIPKDTPVPIRLSILPVESMNRLGKVEIALKGPRGAYAFETFKLYSHDISVIALVRDEGNVQIAAYYQQAFERGKQSYVLIEPEDEPLFDLNSYNVLVCEVGKNVLYTPDIDLLKTYINKGGRLFLVGAEIAWGLADPDAKTAGFPNDIDFLQNYLHADYISDDNPSTSVKGADGDPIGNGLTFSFTSGIQNQDTPDQISPRDGAIPVLYYSSTPGGVAGMRYQDAKNKLVYFGFGLEGVGNVTQRSEIMNRVVAWLMGMTSVEDADNNANAFNLDIYPNPASGRISLPITLAHPSHVRALVYDLAGRHVATLADKEMMEGSSILHMDGATLPSGEYFIHVTTGYGAKTRKLKILH